MEQARKNASMASYKRQEQETGHREGTNRGKDSSFCNADGFLPFKNPKLEQNGQKYQGRVVLRGDVVKDDSRINAALTEQGSSASQMTAAKALDVSANTWRCAGQASDAVSAHTQVKMENAPTLLTLPKFEFVEIWIRLPVGQHTQKCSHSSLLCTVVAFSLLRCVNCCPWLKSH